jgi:hypothetical protein
LVVAAGRWARVVACVAFVVLLACGCGRRSDEGDAPPPALPPAAIRTDADHYELRPGRFGREATIVATFTAPRDTSVYVLHCNGAIGWGVQRRDGDRWVDAWVVATNACLSPPIVVPGGGSYTDTLVLVARSGALIDPGRDRGEFAAGMYRVVWYHVLTAFDPEARPFGPELPLERRVSGPIAIAPAD